MTYATRGSATKLLGLLTAASLASCADKQIVDVQEGIFEEPSAAALVQSSGAPVEVSRVVAIGDSWTCCGGNGQPWVRDIADAIGVPLQNKAESGAPSGDLLAQAQDYVNGGADPDALYLYWNVGNDFNEPGGLDDIEATAATISANMTATLTLLQQAGAQHIVVMNNVDGDLVPRAIENGITDFARQISDLQNAATVSVLSSLGMESSLFDAEALFNELVLDPRFVNVTQGCVDVNCNNPDQFLWWNQNHPTAEAHRLIAAAVREAGNYVAMGESDPGGPDPGSAIEIFSASFESGLAGWQQDSQTDWYSSTQRARDGSRSIEVDGWARNSTVTSPIIDTQGRTLVTVSFWWFIESSLDAGEYLAFDTSVNGSAWVERARLRGNVDQEDTWHEVSVDLVDVQSFQVRFRGEMSRSNEDADVDAVVAIADWGAPVDNPPSITLTAPADNSIVSGNVGVSADAADDNGIVQVEFFVDGDLAFTDAAAPFEFSWETTSATDGVHGISATATDTNQQTASDAVSVEVDNINSPPSITSSPATSVTAGSPYAYQVAATDPDPGEVLTYSLGPAPEGMSIDRALGLVSWTPSAAQAGNNPTEVIVTDDGGSADSQSFTISVDAAPPEPAETLVLEESFSGGLGNGWTNDNQRDWYSSTQRAVDGNRSVEVDGFAWNAALMSPVVDLQGKSNATLSYSWYIESDFRSGEYIALDVAKDGGAWVEYQRLRGDVDPENTWHEVSVEITDASSVQIRFRAFVWRSSADGNVDALTLKAW